MIYVILQHYIDIRCYIKKLCIRTTSYISFVHKLSLAKSILIPWIPLPPFGLTYNLKNFNNAPASYPERATDRIMLVSFYRGYINNKCEAFMRCPHSLIVY